MGHNFAFSMPESCTNVTVQEYMVASSAQVAVMDIYLMFKHNDSKGSLIVILLRRLNRDFDSEST